MTYPVGWDHHMRRYQVHYGQGDGYGYVVTDSQDKSTRDWRGKTLFKTDSQFDAVTEAKRLNSLLTSDKESGNVVDMETTETPQRRYVASRRYDYVGIDEYLGNSCLRTVISGIKPQKLGHQIADLLNAAYEQGRRDATEGLNDFERSLVDN